MIAILGTVLTACSQDSSQQYMPPAVPVFADEVKHQDVPIYFESLGTLKSAAWVEVRPQVSGMLDQVHFSEGQYVQKGDKLFTIDPRLYEIKLAEANAQLAQDDAALETAQKKIQRYQELSKKDLISQQEWDELQSEVAKRSAQVLLDEAKVASAQFDLEHCSICAPISGRTGKVQIHPGNLVATAQVIPLVTLSNIDDLLIEFTLTEREFQLLKPEHIQGEFSIDICSFSGNCEPVKATLTFLNNTFDEKTGLLHLQANLANDNGLFLPGQHVKVLMPIEEIKNAMIVPQKAVKINQTGPYVFLIKDDFTIEMRQVKLGEEIKKSVVILEGLAPHDKIVTEGHLRLSPGMKVEIKNEM